MLFRVTTRVCHSKCVMIRETERETLRVGNFVKEPSLNVMIPAYAKMAHRRLRADLAEMAKIAENPIIQLADSRE